MFDTILRYINSHSYDRKVIGGSDAYEKKYDEKIKSDGQRGQEANEEGAEGGGQRPFHTGIHSLLRNFNGADGVPKELTLALVDEHEEDEGDW